MFKSTSFVPSRYFITIMDDSFGYMGEGRMYMPLPVCELDMEKCLKKWYNHLYKKLPRGMYDFITYLAMKEDEDGSYSDLSMYWGIQEMENDPHIPF